MSRFLGGSCSSDAGLEASGQVTPSLGSNAFRQGRACRPLPYRAGEVSAAKVNQQEWSPYCVPGSSHTLIHFYFSFILLTTFQVSSGRPVSRKKKLEVSEQPGDLPKVTDYNWQSHDLNLGGSDMCFSSNPHDKMIMMVKLSPG